MALKTPLYDAHRQAGATFVEFAGYDMPVHFGSIKEEHHAVRQGAGLFDVSHMSNLWVRGPKASEALSRSCPLDAAALPEGKGKYTVVLESDGTIVDDTFVFRTGPEEFFVIPNAGRNHVVAEHIRHHVPGVSVEDVSPDWAIYALQGPRAKEILSQASNDTPPKFHHIAWMHFGDVKALVSGTGYTGEKGVEIYVPAAHALKVWNHLMQAGQPAGLRPIGLGARDTLRLEKGYCLAGNEFAGGRTPLEAGLSWVLDWNVDFLGRDALRAQQEAGPTRHLVGLVLEKGIPRHGYPVHAEGQEVGQVTSGTLSPTLGKGIALAYVTGMPAEVDVMIRGQSAPARVVKPPFVA